MSNIMQTLRSYSILEKLGAPAQIKIYHIKELLHKFKSNIIIYIHKYINNQKTEISTLK